MRHASCNRGGKVEPGILHRQHVDYRGLRGDHRVAGGFA